MDRPKIVLKPRQKTKLKPKSIVLTERKEQEEKNKSGDQRKEGEFEEIDGAQIEGVQEIGYSGVFGWESTFVQLLLVAEVFELSMNPKTWGAFRCLSRSIYRVTKNGTIGKLLAHQVAHFRRMKEKIVKYGRILDTSMMGCGKTYVTCALARDLHRPLLVFGPENTRIGWRTAARYFGIIPEGVKEGSEEEKRWYRFFSYSAFQSKNNQPFVHSRTSKDYVDFMGLAYVRAEDRPEGVGRQEDKDYMEKLKRMAQGTYLVTEGSLYGDWWVSPEFVEMAESGMMMVFDESHWLKNVSDRTRKSIILSRLMFEIGQEKGVNNYLACLSATPFDKPEHSVQLAKLMGLIKKAELARIDMRTYQVMPEGLSDLVEYCQENFKTDTDHILGYNWDRLLNQAGKSRSLVYKLMTRPVKEHLFDSMPSRSAVVQSDTANLFCRVDNPQGLAQITSGVAQLQSAINSLVAGGGGQALAGVALGIKTIEVGKSHVFIRLAKQILDSSPNAKVIVMLNYIDGINIVKDGLSQYSPLIINGSTSQKKRKEYLSLFQQANTEHRLLINTLSILCQGVDLDDQYGGFKRFLLISPNYHVINLHQATGRVNRAETKSVPEIRFVYAKQVPKEIYLLNRLAKKSEVLQSGLNEVVRFPGDYPRIEEDG